MSGNQKKPFRVAMTLDLTWNLKRHTDVFAGIVRYAQEHADWQCVIDDFAEDTLRHHRGRKRQFDGIIGRVTHGLSEQARRRKIPLVNTWYNSPTQGVPSVLSDPVPGAELLAAHLLARGIRQIACLVRRGDAFAKRLAQRVEEMVTARGGRCEFIRVSMLFAHSPAQWKKTRATVEQWLTRTQAPAGLVVGVDMMGRYCAQICDELGLRVPEDIAIVGGYNEPSICLYPEPTLTSIEYGLDHQGYEAARMMHRLLKGEKLHERVVMVPPRELLVRSSSDFIYVDEEVVSEAMQFIAQNSRRTINVDDVAKATGVSRRTLETRFEKHLGRSVAGEIRRVRLGQAKRLLASSEDSIAKIARLTGIGTPQQFARVFRREVGVSPSEYRGQFVDNE